MHLATKCIFILIGYEYQRFNRVVLVLDSFSVLEFSVDLECGPRHWVLCPTF